MRIKGISFIVNNYNTIILAWNCSDVYLYLLHLCLHSSR